MESAVLTIPQSWNRYAYVLNNPLVIIDPDGMIWIERWDGAIGWYDGPASVAIAWGYKVLPEGTVRIITSAPKGSSWAPFVGRLVVLGSNGRLLDLGPERPTPVEEINFWSGPGTQFLGAYLKFAAEEAIGALTGAGAIKAIKFIYNAAKARRASKATLEIIERGMCFVAGTKVITKDGVKRIEDVKTGDLVLASDPECGTVEYRRVLNTIEREAREVVDISVEGVIITCTPEHPFWAVGEGWTVAEKLKAGSRLLTKEGKIVRVESVKRREGSFKVYNFEVEQLHTYFVSSIGVLAHNNNEICKSGADDLAKALKETVTRPLTEADLGIKGVVKELRGTFSVSNRRAVVKIDYIEGQINNPFEVIKNLSRAAIDRGATSLRIEATLANERLYNALVRRFGLKTQGGIDYILVPLD
jgi:hypothetical protein